MWHWKHCFQGNQGVFFFAKVQNDKAEAEYVFKGKKLFTYQILLLPNWKCHSGVMLLGQTAVDRPGRTISLLTWKLPQHGIKRKRKSVLLFFHQGFRILVELREMNFLKDVCIHGSTIWKSRHGPNLNPRGTLTNNWDLCSSIQDY